MQLNMCSLFFSHKYASLCKVMNSTMVQLLLLLPSKDICLISWNPYLKKDGTNSILITLSIRILTLSEPAFFHVRHGPGGPPWYLSPEASEGLVLKSLVIPALFELYMVKPTRGLELPVILSFYWKPTGNLSGWFPEVSVIDHTL